MASNPRSRIVQQDGRPAILGQTASRSPSVPSMPPSALIEEVRFARDSPLEEEGFEPSVPRKIRDAFETALFASAGPLVPPERPTRSREGLAVRNPLSSAGESVARGTPAPPGENPVLQRLVEILRGIRTPDIVTAF
jgi:hypothetical protein